MLKAFLSENDRGITPNTWWDYEFAGHNKEATLELKALFDGDAPFDTPKPVRLMRRLVELFSSNGDLVLDFFCGSAAFGHAAMELSADKNVHLRFALVQYPEITSRKDYVTIFDVAVERIRRAAKAIRNKTPLFKGDLGFRVFKLASSNIREWQPSGDNLAATLEDAVDHLKSDRTEQDVLYELLLKVGLDLCVPIETKTLAGKAVHSIGGGVLIACLAEKVTREGVEKLGLAIVEWRKALTPAGDTTCVFRDSAFADDVAKTNLAAILEQNGIATVRSL